MSVSSRGLQAIAFIAVAAMLIGFASFSGRVSSWDVPDHAVRADAIIVLTGDDGRLAAGGDLLRAGQARAMLITGVHASVSASDIRNQTRLDQAQIDCCVTLDRRASDTVGNADETARWARSEGYQSLIIVTSDYHMPRSLLEMERALPEAEFIAYPVRTTPPWAEPTHLRLWALEYAKYTMVWLTLSFSG